MATILVAADATKAVKTRARALTHGAPSFRLAHPQRGYPTAVSITDQRPKVLRGDEPQLVARGLPACLLGWQCDQ